MLSRPTTEQILLDCCRELMTGVLPALTDETAQVRVVMLETVLRNMAVRSAHEIAWMVEDTAEIEQYARLVASSAPDADGVGDALDALGQAPRTGLHLDEVAETYVRAGRGVAYLPVPATAAIAPPGVAFIPVDGIPPGQVVLAWDAEQPPRHIADLISAAQGLPG